MSLNGENLSIIVQGPILKNSTKQALESLTKHFPKSKLILSTWEGADTSNLVYDKLILNEDPGASGELKIGQANNVNRIIKSTLSGILNADSDYVLKLRSDMIATDNSILDFYNKIPPVLDNKFKLFSSRVLVSTFYTPNNFLIPFPYHVSDWMYLGKKKDLEYLFDIPLFDINNPQIKETRAQLEEKNFDILYKCLFTPEQYIFSSMIKKSFPELNFKHYCDTSNNNIENSMKYILTNLAPVKPKKVGFFIERYKDIIDSGSVNVFHLCYQDLIAYTPKLFGKSIQGYLFKVKMRFKKLYYKVFGPLSF